MPASSLPAATKPHHCPFGRATLGKTKAGGPLGDCLPGVFYSVRSRKCFSNPTSLYIPHCVPIQTLFKPFGKDAVPRGETQGGASGAGERMTGRFYERTERRKIRVKPGRLCV